jgi:hypothetical protein
VAATARASTSTASTLSFSYQSKINLTDQLGPECFGGFDGAAACFDVLMFDPKTTVPPITAEIAPIITIGSNLIAPNVKANSHIPPAAMATFEIRITFLQLSMTSVSSSI